MPSQPDPAAVFAAALSLWNRIQNLPNHGEIVDLHEGSDELMRRIMRVAEAFESWACKHIDFSQLQDPWVYLLEQDFGRCFCLACEGGEATIDAAIGRESEIAMVLHLPVLPTPKAPGPTSATTSAEPSLVEIQSAPSRGAVRRPQVARKSLHPTSNAHA